MAEPQPALLNPPPACVASRRPPRKARAESIAEAMVEVRNAAGGRLGATRRDGAAQTMGGLRRAG